MSEARRPGDDEVREVHEDREDLERARPVVQVLLQPDRRQVAEEEEPLGVDLGREVHVDADVRQRVRPGRVAEEADEHEPPVAYAPAAPFAARSRHRRAIIRIATGETPLPETVPSSRSRPA